MTVVLILLFIVAAFGGAIIRLLGMDDIIQVAQIADWVTLITPIIFAIYVMGQTLKQRKKKSTRHVHVLVATKDGNFQVLDVTQPQSKQGPYTFRLSSSEVCATRNKEGKLVPVTYTKEQLPQIIDSDGSIRTGQLGSDSVLVHTDQTGCVAGYNYTHVVVQTHEGYYVVDTTKQVTARGLTALGGIQNVVADPKKDWELPVVWSLEKLLRIAAKNKGWVPLNINAKPIQITANAQGRIAEKDLKSLVQTYNNAKDLGQLHSANGTQAETTVRV